MIKSETGTVSMRGTTPVLVSELAFMVKGMRESFAKEYGESAAEELISRAMEASKAEGDLDEIMQGLIHDTFDILTKVDRRKDNTENPISILEDILRKAFEDMIKH
jgi:hypothetical protein